MERAYSESSRSEDGLGISAFNCVIIVVFLSFKYEVDHVCTS